jgi:hypothetical protein
MKISKILFFLFFLLASFYVSGQKVHVSGSGSGYKNASLRFFSRTDPVTGRLKPILTIVCDDKGSFSCELDCRKSEYIYIKTGIYNLHLLISDSSEYELLLPDWIAKPGNEEQNPFFIETETIPEVVNNKDDINNLIGKFDSEYNPVFNLVADRVFKKYGKEEIENAIRKLDKYSEVKDPPFFYDYVRCRMIMLDLVATSSKTGMDDAMEFINKRFNSSNQAFLDLAEQMFTGYFNIISTGPLKDSFNRSVSLASFSEMRSVILQDSKITNSELADFVILLNLNNGYYERNLPGENTRKIISIMKTQGETDLIKVTAANVLDKINSSLPGSFPTGFSLRNADGNLMGMNNFRGKYLLLSFANGDDQFSVTELGIINMWQKKYITDLAVVTILSDKDFKSASDKFRKLGFNWTFLDGSDREILEFTYYLKMYPSFMLLDREGKIIANPCPFPSENLELTINKILSGDPTRSGTQNR